MSELYEMSAKSESLPYIMGSLPYIMGNLPYIMGFLPYIMGKAQNKSLCSNGLQHDLPRYNLDNLYNLNREAKPFAWGYGLVSLKTIYTIRNNNALKKTLFAFNHKRVNYA